MAIFAQILLPLLEQAATSSGQDLSPNLPAQLLNQSRNPLLRCGETSSTAGFLGLPKLLAKFVLKPDDIYTSGMERLAAQLAARGVGWREAAIAFSSNLLTSSHRN